MGLIVSVYRDADGIDCTLNGISSRFQRLCVVNAEGPFEPRDDMPAVLLENHYQKCLRIVPAQKDATGHWHVVPSMLMAGGNFAHTSDSRFSEACERLTGQQWYGAVAIHDRIEK